MMAIRTTIRPLKNASGIVRRNPSTRLLQPIILDRFNEERLALLHTSSIRQQEGKSKEQEGDKNVESQIERRKDVIAQIRDVLNRKREDLEPRIKQQLESLGKRWNTYSGYEEVIAAKADVLEAEIELKSLREEQNILRQGYMKATGKRASSQQTVNKLLQRREDWSDADLNAYMELIKSEHGEARNEREATEKYESIGHKVNAAWDDVVRKTLERYHQEQIWSDRVRAGSTYGSMIIAGLNVAIFILAFLVVEPYKRKKLAQTFESRLLEGESLNAQMLAGVVQDFESHLKNVEQNSAETNKSLDLLMVKAGISPSIEEGENQDQINEGNQQIHSPYSSSNGQANQYTVGQKRRDMGLAGALGFAVGAGLLAAFGALQS